jgi:hypothetical protein
MSGRGGVRAPVLLDRSWLGSASGTGRIVGDLIAPVLTYADWEAAR